MASTLPNGVGSPVPPDSNVDSAAVHVRELPCSLATQAAAIQSRAIREPEAMRMEVIRTVTDVEVVIHGLEMKLWLFPFDWYTFLRLLHRPPVRLEDRTQLAEVEVESVEDSNQQEAR